MKRFIYIPVTILLVFQAFVSGQAVVTKDQIRLTTPEAPWTLVIDGNNLDIKTVQTKPGGAYFLIYPDKDGLNISVFIEPADKCKTSDGCRDFVLNTGNPAWGKFQGLVKSRFGDFSYFEFFRPEVQGQPLKMQDMYAQYVESGYWVDLHISKVLYKKEDKLLFEKLISSIKFVPKAKDQSYDSDRSIASLEKTANNWLTLWGAAKCKESHNSLTSISRDAITEKQWTDYCEAAHKALGKLKSRKLIATTMTKSLPGKPDRSGAAFRYQSVFDRGPVIEFVSLTLEKDGTWTVSNYRTQ